MKTHGCLAIGLLVAPLLMGCGGDNGGTRAGQPNTPQPYRTNYPPGRGVSDTQVGPPAQDMPGGGRGSDPSHFKGKP
jgi:hypothetical protein